MSSYDDETWSERQSRQELIEHDHEQTYGKPEEPRQEPFTDGLLFFAIALALIGWAIGEFSDWLAGYGIQLSRVSTSLFLALFVFMVFQHVKRGRLPAWARVWAISGSTFVIYLIIGTPGGHPLAVAGSLIIMITGFFVLWFLDSRRDKLQVARAHGFDSILEFEVADDIRNQRLEKGFDPGYEKPPANVVRMARIKRVLFNKPTVATVAGALAAVIASSMGATQGVVFLLAMLGAVIGWNIRKVVVLVASILGFAIVYLGLSYFFL
jgi:hypothetical protein